MGQVRQKLYGSHDPYADFDITEILPFSDFGWNSQSPEFALVIDKLQPKLIIEVGTYYGGSARHMAELALKYHPDVEIVCIDTFLGSVEHWHNHTYFKPEFFKYGRPPIYDQFISNVIHTNLQDTITPFPIDSINGGLTLERYGIQADLVYIDAGHEYESVSADIRIFKHLVRPGGVLMLDDSHYEPIQRAAHDNLTGTLQIKGTKILCKRLEPGSSPSS